jgi:hypothetical protein
MHGFESKFISSTVVSSIRKTLEPRPSLRNVVRSSTILLSPIYLSIYLWLYSHLLDLGSFFSFLILHTVCRTPWTGDQPVAKPQPTHRTRQWINVHTSMPWVGFEPTIPAFQRAKTVHAFDRAATVIGSFPHSQYFPDVLNIYRKIYWIGRNSRTLMVFCLRLICSLSANFILTLFNFV